MIHQFRDKKQIMKRRKNIQTLIGFGIFLFLVICGVLVYLSGFLNYIGRPIWKAKKAVINSVESSGYVVRTKASVFNENQNLLKENDDLKAFSIKLSKALKEEKPIQQKVETQVGLICISHGFTILIGRTAKENDFLLRHQTRGNDYWFHTRDYPGGYVFIKNIRNKSIPLDTLLDAANLAVLFSKGKNAGKIDLYYTQVKYLRRAKNGPLGLVLPTNEKNLCIDFNKLRAQQLLEK